MTPCPNCYLQLADDANFCSRCGTNLSTGLAPGKKKSSTTVVLVAVAAVLFLALPFVLIVAAIAIPNLIRARISANQSSAVASVRRMSTALLGYAERHDQQYPATLAALASDPQAVAQGQLDSALLSGQKNGYRFRYQGLDTDGDGTLDGFTIYADPLIEDRTGKGHFFGDQTGIIRRSDGPAPASAESPPLQ